MARLLLADDEDLVERFRPHPASYLPRYAAALLWAAYGLLAWTAHRTLPPGQDWAGAAAFALLALVHAVALRGLGKRGFAHALAWTGAGAAVVLLLILAVVPASLAWVGHGWLLGAAAAVYFLVGAEFDRLRRVHDLTSKRLIRRTGVGRVFEESIPLDRVVAVQASQGALGQVLGFGQLALELKPVVRRRRRKDDPGPPTLVLSGVPRWPEVKHHVEVLLDEHRLPPKQRQQRTEERRLKESMRALASWVRQGGP